MIEIRIHGRGAPVGAFTRIDERKIHLPSEIYTPDGGIDLETVDEEWALREAKLEASKTKKKKFFRVAPLPRVKAARASARREPFFPRPWDVRRIGSWPIRNPPIPSAWAFV
jgi:hypothetical protein